MRRWYYIDIDNRERYQQMVTTLIYLLACLHERRRESSNEDVSAVSQSVSQSVSQVVITSFDILTIL